VCGITALYNVDKAPSKILDMIVAQEHRGKDATGIAYIDKEKGLIVAKKAITPSAFKSQFEEFFSKVESKICIGHNRLASTNHKERYKDKEAHPFLSEDGSFALVHNGTFIGYEYMAHFLDSIGHKRSSGTDTEIFVHILEELLKRYPREEAIRRFYPLSEGNILILFNDGTLYGIPGRSFYVLTVGKSLLIASESRTFLVFKDLEGSKLYTPDEGCLLKVKDKVELIGNWEEHEFKKGDWVFNSEITCDFCGQKRPCQKFYLNKNGYDRCYQCYLENKVVPRYRRNYTQPYNNPYNWPLPNEEEDEKEKKKTEYGICYTCKKRVPLDHIIICSICRRTYCLEHIEDHDCDNIGEENLEVRFN